jgi:hypothetical protein
VLLLCTNRPAWKADGVSILEDISSLAAECLPEGIVQWEADKDMLVDVLMAINCNQACACKALFFF